MVVAGSPAPPPTKLRTFREILLKQALTGAGWFGLGLLSLIRRAIRDLRERDAAKKYQRESEIEGLHIEFRAPHCCFSNGINSGFHQRLVRFAAGRFHLMRAVLAMLLHVRPLQKRSYSSRYASDFSDSGMKVPLL